MTVYKTINYVFGTDIKTMSEGDLIQSIRKVEGEISTLKQINTKSKRISAEIEELTQSIEKIVEELDAR